MICAMVVGIRASFIKEKKAWADHAQELIGV
jgi:hypothetical protein